MKTFEIEDAKITTWSVGNKPFAAGCADTLETAEKVEVALIEAGFTNVIKTPVVDSKELVIFYNIEAA